MNNLWEILSNVAVLLAIVGAIVAFAYWRGGLDEWRNGLGEWRKDVNDGFKEVRNEIRALGDRIDNVLLGRQGGPTSNRSPITLNELGIRISEEVGAKDWVQIVVSNIHVPNEIHTAYGVQQFCFDYVRGAKNYASSPGMSDKMQISAYNYGLTLTDIENVVAIELRDVLLAIHGLEAPE